MSEKLQSVGASWGGVTRNCLHPSRRRASRGESNGGSLGLGEETFREVSWGLGSGEFGGPSLTFLSLGGFCNTTWLFTRSCPFSVCLLPSGAARIALGGPNYFSFQTRVWISKTLRWWDAYITVYSGDEKGKTKEKLEKYWGWGCRKVACSRENSGVSLVALDKVVFLIPVDGVMRPGAFKRAPLVVTTYNCSPITAQKWFFLHKHTFRVSCVNKSCIGAPQLAIRSSHRIHCSSEFNGLWELKTLWTYLINHLLSVFDNCINTERYRE